MDYQDTSSPNFDRYLSTFRSTTTIATTSTTERRRPEPRRDRVNCFTCGSLFTTDAPDCGTFNASDSSQRKTCDSGDVCLWYSYLESAVIHNKSTL